jgi:DNA-directed RNA polymerase subunit RPC12/RpoP
MNTRCPRCGRELATRKLANAIIVRMELDCPGCQQRLRLNLHPAETTVVLAATATFLALAVMAYQRQSHALLLAALAAGLLGMAAVYAVERHWLRDWPRYVVNEMK